MECNEMRKKNSEADRPIKKKKNEGSKIGDDSSLQIQSFAWPMGKRGWKGTNQWGRWRRRHWRIQLATASEAGESRESGQTNWQRPRREAKAKHVRIACNNFANFPPPTPRRNVWSLSLRLKKKQRNLLFFSSVLWRKFGYKSIRPRPLLRPLRWNCPFFYCNEIVVVFFLWRYGRDKFFFRF